MGKSITFRQVDEASVALAAWLQAQGFAKGDRIAVMLPNVPQYPVAIAGILRAGLVVVNVNPLYTPRELEHQLKDSGAKAIIIIENFASVLAQVMPAVPTKTVVLAAMGDMLGFPKGTIVNYVVRKVKKMVPAFDLPGAVRFNDALSAGRGKPFKPAQVGPDDIAVLQYTGGTTGVSKGAVLLHSNLVANILQSEAWYQPALKKIPKGEQVVTICALPIYHIFGFNTNVMLSMRMGGANILIPNPRDLPAVFKQLQGEKFHSFPAVNTLFNAMANHPDFGTVDWSGLVISVGGGMAVQSATAKLWLEKTGCPIVEGYGLSETSPSASCNPVDSTAYSGNIGLPMPNTEMKLLDDDGNEVPLGERGEIAIKGPQVMAGYWQRPDETAKVMTAGRLLPQRRHRRGRRARLLQDRRPQEGHDPGQRLQRLSERGRGRGHADARHPRVRRGRHPRREGGRGGQAGDRQEGPGGHRGAGARLLRGQPHRLQAAQGGRVPHRAAEDAGRQDPAPGAARQDLSSEGGALPAADTLRRMSDASAPEPPPNGNGTERVIWVKTDEGRAEMQSRALVKERARRNLLLLIDGTKSEEMLLGSLAGVTAADFQELRKLDLIAPAAGAVTVGNAARAASARLDRPTVPQSLAHRGRGRRRVAARQRAGSAPR